MKISIMDTALVIHNFNRMDKYVQEWIVSQAAYTGCTCEPHKKGLLVEVSKHSTIHYKKAALFSFLYIVAGDYDIDLV